MMAARLAGCVFMVLFAASVCFAAPAAPAVGQRIAVVNLERVFREYFRHQIIEDALRQQAEIYRARMVQESSRLARMKAELDMLAGNAKNPVLTEDARKRAAADAAVKERELASKEAELKLYMSERLRTMREAEQKKRDEVMADIYQEIDRRAVAEGFDFVFDSSGKTANSQPAVLRFPASCDLTDAVIRELNRTRPEVRPEEKNTQQPREGSI